MQMWEQIDVEPRARPVWTTWMLVAGAVALTAATTAIAIVLLGRASDTAVEHAVLLTVAGAAIGVVAWYALARRPGLRLAVLATGVATVAIAVTAGGLLSRSTTVDEDVIVATATPTTAAQTTPPPTAAAPTPATAPTTAAPERPNPTTTDGAETAPAPTRPTPRSKPRVATPPERSAPAATPTAVEPPASSTPPATDENVLVASGAFEPLEHPGRGTASIIRTPDGGHVLTLTKFATDGVPDPFVWLVADNDAAQAARHVSLGKLKGSEGDQQYTIPPGTDPTQFTHVYVWCRVFASGVTRAPLR